VRPGDGVRQWKVYRGSRRTILLREHARIQLEVGRPLLTPEHVAFPRGL
jgi:hypothetical protein